MSDLISIIVPVYNVEKYIDECILSLINQTYSNIEIILIDDGSTDDSGEICDEYQKKDNRILVFHTENKGVFHAKSIGIRNATGKYIGFVDSDDWIELTMYEKLYANIIKNNSDICMCELSLSNTLGTVYTKQKNTLSRGVYDISNIDNKIYRKMFLCDPEKAVDLILCNKLYKSSLIKNNLKFVDDKLHYFEDISLCTLAMLEANKLCVIDESLYIYRQRDSSLCHSKDNHYLEQINIFYNTLLPYMNAWPEFLRNNFEKYIADRAIWGINNMLGLKLTKRINYYYPPYNLLKNYSKIVVYGAGAVGYSYYSYLEKTHPHKLVGWVDKQYEALKKQGLNVDSPLNLVNMDFDLILIGVLFEDIAEQIIDSLVNAGVKRDALLWCKPETILE